MPSKYIQRRPVPFLNSTGGAAGIGVDSDNDEIKYKSGSTVFVVLPNEPITVDLNANSVDKHVFIADANYQVIGAKVVVSTAGVAGSTVQITKCTSTVAPASGAALLTSALTLAGTANFVFSGTLSSTTADLQLVAGDRIGVDMTGTLTSLVGVAMIYVKRIE